MTFTLTIRTDNAAFEDDPFELSRAVRSVGARLAEIATHGLTPLHAEETVRDVNGNTVGAWKVTGE